MTALDVSNYYQKKILETQIKIRELLELITYHHLEYGTVRERWLNNNDVINRFRISRSKLYNLKKRGLIEPHSFAGKDFYLESELIEILKNRKKPKNRP